MIIKVPRILLPNNKIDLTRWAIIACDQFTSQHDYWDKVNALTKGVPSTRHLVLPEIYLPLVSDAMISGINATMQSYIDDGILTDVGECFVLVERSTPYTPRRLGLVISVDLDEYSFIHADKAQIRATEGTVTSRIPPRVRIRKDAIMELPHIMLLYNDPENTVMSKILQRKDDLPKLYDFDLCCNGGHLCGYKITETESIIADILSLAKDGMTFAVGDGNHSLATAKAVWDEIKKDLSPAQRENHPARYALVEAVNLFDEGIAFEPIHRVVFNCNYDLIDRLSNIEGTRAASMFFNGKEYFFTLPVDEIEAVSAVQKVIDEYLADNPSASVDYVHGEADALTVAEEPNSLAVLLPTLPKERLFEYVTAKGSLPRKTFSMGEAVEKRYYVEAKMIVKV